MGEKVSGQDEVVEPWSLNQVVIRRYEGAAIAVSAQSKAWIAVWAAAGLGVTVVLAVTGAPEVAYVVTGGILLLAAHAGLRHPKARS